MVAPAGLWPLLSPLPGQDAPADPPHAGGSANRPTLATQNLARVANFADPLDPFNNNNNLWGGRGSPVWEGSQGDQDSMAGGFEPLASGLPKRHQREVKQLASIRQAEIVGNLRICWGSPPGAPLFRLLIGGMLGRPVRLLKRPPICPHLYAIPRLGVDKMEHLVTAVIVAPFVITMVGFAVAIAFSPAVPNEIAPATDHDHDSRPLILFRGGSAWDKPR
jgi:hypothetical protein